MKLGIPKDVRLTRAKQTFLFDCQVAGLSRKTIKGYGSVIDDFIKFTGDMLVRELKPDHVRMYLAELFSRKLSQETVKKRYRIVRMWIKWMYAQNAITKPLTDFPGPPRLSKLLIDEEVLLILFFAFLKDLINVGCNFFRLQKPAQFAHI